MIRTWADIAERGGTAWLTPAERALMDSCCRNQRCILGDGTLPAAGQPTPARHIRAEVLRYLILGGCPSRPVDGLGVGLRGAYVTGVLDLSFRQAFGMTTLTHCRFERPIMAIQSEFALFDLTQSALAGLRMNGAVVRGNLTLNRAVSSAKLRLKSVKVNGQMDCAALEVTSGSGFAVNAQSMEVGGDARFEGAVLAGGISVAGAQVIGQLDFEEAVLLAPDATAFFGQGMRVNEGFFWRGIKRLEGAVSVSSAKISDLFDDIDSWAMASELNLDGLTYRRISNSGGIEARHRLAWLAQGSAGRSGFRPQPYSQFAKFLRGVGHDHDAREVLYAREGLLRADVRARTRVVPNGDVAVGFRSLGLDLVRPWLWVWHGLEKWVVGYGHKPFRSLIVLLVLMGLAFVPTERAWKAGDFAPNAPLVLNSATWLALSPTADNPAQAWSETEQGRDWETFSALAYAADLVIPIIELGQTDAWAPSTSRGPWGWHLWWARWAFTLAGWIVTALGAAAITGIIRRD